MSNELDLDDHPSAAPTMAYGRATPGKRSMTQGLAPRPMLFRRATRDDRGVAPDAEAAVDRAAGTSGAPLPAHVQRQFEGSLGADLSGVRVHTGADSADAAHAVGAKAYTVGDDIHFAAGHYQPDDPFGLHLLAHEVAHTVQQRGAAPTRQHKLEVSAPHDAAEHDADRAADAMVRGEPTTVGGAARAVARSVVSEVAPRLGGGIEVGPLEVGEFHLSRYLKAKPEYSATCDLEVPQVDADTTFRTKGTMTPTGPKSEYEVRRVITDNWLGGQWEVVGKNGVDLGKQTVDVSAGLTYKTKAAALPVELGARVIPFSWGKDGKVKLAALELSGKLQVYEQQMQIAGQTVKVKVKQQVKLKLEPDYKEIAAEVGKRISGRLASGAQSLGAVVLPASLIAGGLACLFGVYDTITSVDDIGRIAPAAVRARAHVWSEIDRIVAGLEAGSDTSGIMGRLTLLLAPEIGTMPPDALGALLKLAHSRRELRQMLWVPARARLIDEAITEFRQRHQVMSWLRDQERSIDGALGIEDHKLRPTNAQDALQIRLEAELPSEIDGAM